MALSAQRKGEIALLILKAKLRKDGLRLGNDFRRELFQTAKELGIDPQELKEFVREFAQGLFEETFA